MNGLDLSVAIITYNAERTLRRVLASLPPGIELIVLDSGSIDTTRELAREFGAEVHQRPFVDYGDQKNAVLELCSRSWILSLDADEELSPRLRQFLVDNFAVGVGKTIEYGGFRVCRRLVFRGRLMRFADSKSYTLRIFRRGSGRFVGRVHARFLSDVESAGTTPGFLIHHSYSGLLEWIEKQKQYGELVAREKFEAARGEVNECPSVSVTYLVPLGVFFYRYVLNVGFLDCTAGLFYSAVRGYYRYRVLIKLRELYGR